MVLAGPFSIRQLAVRAWHIDYFGTLDGSSIQLFSAVFNSGFTRDIDLSKRDPASIPRFVRCLRALSVDICFPLNPSFSSLGCAGCGDHERKGHLWGIFGDSNIGFKTPLAVHPGARQTYVS